jgi:hypothetical protein
MNLSNLTPIPFSLSADSRALSAPLATGAGALPEDGYIHNKIVSCK